jgi:tRNA U38,U39,U40 pseudouridine synthase TruA
MAKVLESRERANAAPTAPAHGLCLVQVRYPEAGAD